MDCFVNHTWENLNWDVLISGVGLDVIEFYCTLIWLVKWYVCMWSNWLIMFTFVSELDLQSCLSLKPAHLMHICSLPELRRLNLYNREVSEDFLQALGKWANTKHFYMHTWKYSQVNSGFHTWFCPLESGLPPLGFAFTPPTILCGQPQKRPLLDCVRINLRASKISKISVRVPPIIIYPPACAAIVSTWNI